MHPEPSEAFICLEHYSTEILIALEISNIDQVLRRRVLRICSPSDHFFSRVISLWNSVGTGNEDFFDTRFTSKDTTGKLARLIHRCISYCEL